MRREEGVGPARRGQGMAGGSILSVLLGMGIGDGDGVGVGAGDGNHWRVYRAAAGMSETFSLSVNVSARGNVWVRHPLVSGVSWLDGYQVRTIDGTEEARYPVYESRTGQIWSLYQDGLMEFRRGQWMRIPAGGDSCWNIRSAQPDCCGPFHCCRWSEITCWSSCPINSRSTTRRPPRQRILRQQEQTKLGGFIEMIEARDGGGWLTGTGGLAKLPSPIRRLWRRFCLGGARSGSRSGLQITSAPTGG
jgi:hypothetical protein